MRIAGSAVATGEAEPVLHVQRAQALQQLDRPAEALAARFEQGFLDYGKRAGEQDGMAWVEDRYIGTFSGVTASDTWVVGVRGAPDAAAAAADPCARKGVCCDCISYHLQSRQLPACVFPADSEATFDRSFEHFARLVGSGRA